jgi:hypothetical protein
MKFLTFLARFIENLLFCEVIGFMVTQFIYALDLTLSIHYGWLLPSFDRYLFIYAFGSFVIALKHTINEWEEKRYERYESN